MMLLGEDLRGRHQRGLSACCHRGEHCIQRDHRLAASHIALQQAIHGRGSGKVARDLADDAILRRGERKREQRANPRIHLVDDLDALGAGTRHRALSQGHGRLEDEQLLVHQGPPALGGLLQRFRAVYQSQEARRVGQSAPPADRFREGFLDERSVPLERLVDHRGKGPAGEALGQGVQGHDLSAQTRFTVELVEPRCETELLAVEANAAFHRDLTALLELALEISLTEPGHAQASGVVLDLGDRAASSSASRTRDRGGHDRSTDRDFVSVSEARDRCFAAQHAIRPGHEQEEVFDRLNARLGQLDLARRAHALERAHLDRRRRSFQRFCHVGPAYPRTR